MGLTSVVPNFQMFWISTAIKEIFVKFCLKYRDAFVCLFFHGGLTSAVILSSTDNFLVIVLALLNISIQKQSFADLLQNRCP